MIIVVLMRLFGNQMYWFFVLLFSWIAVYIFTLALLASLDSAEEGLGILSPNRDRSIIVYMLLVLIFRLIFLGSEIHISLDALWYLDFGKFISMGMMPYADFYFPYPPVFAYFIATISYSFPAFDSFRLLATFFDLMIVAVLWYSIRTMKNKGPLGLAPIAYSLLPLAIIESGLNGHFEPIANLFLLVSIIFLYKKKLSLSGIFLGISAATKIYAVFLVPLFLVNISGGYEKLKYTLYSLSSAGIAFIPLVIPVWLRGDWLLPGAAMRDADHAGFLGSLFGFVGRLDPFHLLSVLFGFGIIILIMWLYIENRHQGETIPKQRIYVVSALAIGVILFLMGIVAGFYPFTLRSLEVFWRFPPDMAIVRGVLTITSSGFLIYYILTRVRGTESERISLNRIVILSSVLLLLMLSLSRHVFYGWYLLWVLPPLLFIRRRKLVVLIVVSILFIYPSYTHDNFQSLGYSEGRSWQNEFNHVSGWNVSIQGASIDTDEIQVITDSYDGVGVFGADLSDVDASILDSLQITWSKDVEIEISHESEFVVRFSSDWDPTFGKVGTISLQYAGTNNQGLEINGTIVPSSYSPTNLSFVLWRFSFLIVDEPNLPSLISKLNITLNPNVAQEMTFLVEEMYLTTTSYSNQYTPVIVPSLILLNLCSLFALYNVVSKREEAGYYAVSSSKST
jgi:hypothetical protein